MKCLRSVTRKLIFILALCPVPFALSQIPQGFNYQAVARLTTGDPIINTTLPVRITIQADSLGTSVIWQELHSTITTNGFGLFTLILGKGARQAVSTVATFSAIDWTVSPKFIKTEINYSGWKTMGVTRFWSVPYAKIAENLGGPVKKLAVTGTTLINDEALFEVKNKDGNTVFAVYNEGVRVYVADGAKGLKGGFAVGGFGTDKAESQKYMIVSRDSTRIYVDSHPAKKLKGGFAVGGYDMTKAFTPQDYLDVSKDSVRIYIDSDPSTKTVKGGFAVGGYDMTKAVKSDYFNVTSAASAEVVKNEPRVLWYPKKSALLGGEVHVGTADSVGQNSTALGFRSIAKGNQSQAFGYRSLAYGNYSSAIGFKAESNTNGMAVGYLAKASGSDAFALGSGAMAIANKSFAFGSVGIDSIGNVTGNTKATGEYAYAFGLGSVASGRGSFAIGANDTASLDFATAIGYKVKAANWYAVAMGSYSEASGRYSTAIGYRNKATADGATAMGRMSEATATNAFASGYLSKATFSAATAMGYKSQAIATGALAAGYQNIASNTGSTALGRQTTASGLYSMTFGYLTAASNSYAMAGGYNSRASGQYSFSFGRDLLASADHSVAMGYWGKAFGYTSMATGYHTRGSGQFSLAGGFETTARAYASVAFGRWNDSIATSSQTAWTLTDPLFIIGNGSASTAVNNAFVVFKNGNTKVDGNFYPSRDNVNSLGLSTNRWTVVYATTGAINTSDARKKSEIADLTYGLKEILQLRPVSFRWKEYPERGKNLGLVAQEVLPVVGEIVDIGSDPDHTLGINYSGLVPVLIRSIQEQQQVIEEQKLKNQQLEKQIADINAKLELIEKKMK